MNLYANYSPLYWACACLSVNAGSSNTDFESTEEFGDEEDEGDALEENSSEDSEENAEEIDSKAKKKNITNYGKVAKAIGNMQSRNINIQLPNVNKSEMDFVPDIETNSILYGMQAIVSMNDELGEKIITNRPFSSMVDFVEKICPTNLQMITLIKSGMFDELEKINRFAIMEKYLQYHASIKIKKKEKLTLSNLPKILEYNILPKDFEIQKRMYMYKKYIVENEFDKPNKTYVLLNEATVDFFEENIKRHFKLENGASKYYCKTTEGYLMSELGFRKVYEAYMNNLKPWLEREETAELVYKTEKDLLVQELKDKYCKGGLNTWEMASLSFYYHEHELAHVNNSAYHIVNFNDLPEVLTPTGFKKNKQDKEYPIYDIVAIAGTVLNTDNIKHIVTVLTIYGVVDVKFYKGVFLYYNKQISTINEKGKKEVIDKSWFARGNKIHVAGVRRENNFIPKRDFEKGFRHTVQLIEEILPNGTLVTKKERG